MHSAFVVHGVSKHRPFVRQRITTETYQFRSSIVLVDHEGPPSGYHWSLVRAFPIEHAAAFSLDLLDGWQTGVLELVRVLVLR